VFEQASCLPFQPVQQDIVAKLDTLSTEIQRPESLYRQKLGRWRS
jgi:hypothetical protein